MNTSWFIKQTQFITLLIITLSFTTSCQNKEFPKKLILEKDTLGFSYKVYETRHKTNEDNEVQCAKYFEYKSSNDGYKIMGADLNHLISFLLDTQKRNLQIPPEIDDRFYEVTFEGKNDSTSQRILLNDFLESYKLELEKYVQKEEGYKLTLDVNEKPLNKEKSNQSTVALMDGHYELTNPDLKILALTLQELYSKEFVVESNSALHDIKFSTSTALDTNLKLLKDNYGVNSKKIKREVVKYKVTKRESF